MLSVIASFAIAGQLLALCWLAILHRKLALVEMSVPDEANFSALRGRIEVMETTWEEVYSRLRKVAGRIDKTAGLEASKEAPAPSTELEQKQAILRQFLTGKRAG